MSLGRKREKDIVERKKKHNMSNEKTSL